MLKRQSVSRARRLPGRWAENEREVARLDEVEGQLDIGSIDLKCHLDPAAWVLPGKINAMENCAYCNGRLTTLSGEVNMRFIVLLNLFDRSQGSW